MPAYPPEILALIEQSRKVVDHVTFDEVGEVVAGSYVGGNGGLRSQDSLREVSKLARVLHELGYPASTHRNAR